MKTIYVPVKFQKKLQRCCKGSSGPYSSISEMKKIWGKNARVAKCGSYLYNLDFDDYCMFRIK